MSETPPPDDVASLVERLSKLAAAPVAITQFGRTMSISAGPPEYVLALTEAASLITTQAQRIEELTAELKAALLDKWKHIHDRDVTIGKLETALQASEARATRAEGERDDWKRLAEHHFGHMRAALDLSYALKYLFDPEFLERVAEAITCGDDCENAWREHDTNATGCSKQDTEGCPFDDACQLRDMAKAVRVQAWTLAFSPSAEARILSLEAEVKRKDEALSRIASDHIRIEGGKFPNGHIYHVDCDACHRQDIARASLQPQEGKDA